MRVDSPFARIVARALVAALFMVCIFTGADAHQPSAENTADDSVAVEVDEPLSSPPSVLKIRTAPQSTTDSESAAESNAPDHTHDASTADEPTDDAGQLAPGIDLEELDIEPASFNGIKPGLSDSAAVDEAWGEPAEVARRAGVEQRVYALEPFERVVISLRDGIVESIVVNLQQRFAPEEMAKQLGLSEFHPTSIRDAQGTPLGLVYPERGVLFGFAPEGDRLEVLQLIIEPIGAEAFVARAANQFRVRPHASLNDLLVAMTLDSQATELYLHSARTLAYAGRLEEALVSIDAALEANEDPTTCRLQRVRILMQLGRFVAANDELDRVLENDELTSDQRCEATLLAGDLLAQGPAQDFKQSIEYHLRAIKLAEPLLADDNFEIRRAAERMAIEAHLAVAEDVARGQWRRKSEVVPMWLDRATELADATATSGQERLRWQLQVSRTALSACTACRGAFDPGGYLEQARRAGEQLISDADDSWDEQRLAWQLGLVLSDATRVTQLQGDPAEALRLGSLALDYLELGGELMSDHPAAARQLGRAYFRVGSIHAVQKRDHSAALEYFAQAVPLVLESLEGTPPGELADQGEALVSMAISMWEEGQQADAVQLTERGAKLIDQAVEAGYAKEQMLAVPYGNLAKMHRHLGHDERASEFERLAGRPNEGRRQ